MSQPSAYTNGANGKRQKAIVNGQQCCSKCGDWKPVGAFDPRSDTYNKIETRCRDCERQRRREWGGRDIASAMKQLFLRHKSGGILTRRRRQLRETSSLTLAFLMQLWERQQGLCAVTHAPMTYIQGQGQQFLTNVSIDRIDNQFGYTPDNVRLVCKAVNWMKNKMTDREMLQWAALILNGPAAMRP